MSRAGARSYVVNCDAIPMGLGQGVKYSGYCATGGIMNIMRARQHLRAFEDRLRGHGPRS